MTTPIFWLAVSIVVVLLYFVLLLADNILQHGMGAGRKLWRRHIVAEFPYPPICFDCEKPECKGCEILKRRGPV